MHPKKDIALIPLNSKTYLSLILIFTPLLNFLSGITIDIYSPSLPTLMVYFNTSMTLVKNTLSITLLGWALGSMIFGLLIDTLGRKPILTYALIAYVLSSFLATLTHDISGFMMLRFMQGFTISAISIGCRAIIVDYFTGPRYLIAILYTSIGYGLGPLVGPFIGGILQYYVSWKASFITLSALGSLLLLILVIFINESVHQKQQLSLTQIHKKIKPILFHKSFLAGIILLGLMQIQTLIYPTLGPFLVIDILKKDTITFGNSALLVGASYLIGTMINRILLHFLTAKTACYIGYLTLLLGLVLSLSFSIFSPINLITIMLPLIIICLSSGLIFSNIMAINLMQFTHSAGLATSFIVTLMLLTTTAGTFIMSHIHICHLSQLSLMISSLTILQIMIFFRYFKPLFNNA